MLFAPPVNVRPDPTLKVTNPAAVGTTGDVPEGTAMESMASPPPPRANVSLLLSGSEVIVIPAVPSSWIKPAPFGKVFKNL